MPKNISTVTQFLESVKQQMCDDYCYYRHMAELNKKMGQKDADERLDAVCENCPMSLM